MNNTATENNNGTNLGDAGKDIVDGVGDAGKDLINGVENAGDALTGNETNRTE